jgi:hypothetical protein
MEINDLHKTAPLISAAGDATAISTQKRPGHNPRQTMTAAPFAKGRN